MSLLDALVSAAVLLAALALFAGAAWLSHRAHDRRPPVCGKGEV